MPSPNKNSAEMYAWLKEANAAQFEISAEFGSPGMSNSTPANVPSKSDTAPEDD